MRAIADSGGEIRFVNQQGQVIGRFEPELTPQEIEEIPAELLVVGGGYIGMELGTVYAALGSKVVVVEALDSILTGADPDLVRPVMNFARKAFKEVRLKTKVAKMATSGKHIKVSLDDGAQTKEELYDRVLVSVGRVIIGQIAKDFLE